MLSAYIAKRCGVRSTWAPPAGTWHAFFSFCFFFYFLAFGLFSFPEPAISAFFASLPFPSTSPSPYQSSSGLALHLQFCSSSSSNSSKNAAEEDREEEHLDSLQLQGELNNGVRADHLAAAPHPDHNRRGGSLHHLPLAEWRNPIVLPAHILM